MTCVSSRKARSTHEPTWAQLQLGCIRRVAVVRRGYRQRCNIVNARVLIAAWSVNKCRRDEDAARCSRDLGVLALGRGCRTARRSEPDGRTTPRSRGADPRYGGGVGPDNAALLAGIGEVETNFAHCWSEATWACQGPASASCGGGPVIAGASDGPCSAQQGGLGMFQFDSGTFSQTLATYGPTSSRSRATRRSRSRSW